MSTSEKKEIKSVLEHCERALKFVSGRILGKQYGQGPLVLWSGRVESSDQGEKGFKLTSKLTDVQAVLWPSRLPRKNLQKVIGT